jgi:hypothetical protein
MKTTKALAKISLVIAVSLLFFSASMIAQEKKITEKEVPAAVLNSFHKAYPKAEIKGLSTEKEHGKKYFEIESMDGTVRRDLLFTPSGKIAEIEETIPASELPNGAMQSIEKKIPGAKVEHAEKVTSGSKVTYELSVTGTKGKYGVVLNNDGKVVTSRKAKGEEDKEGDEG